MFKFTKMLIVFTVVESCIQYNLIPCQPVRREDISTTQAMVINACYEIQSVNKVLSSFKKKSEAEAAVKNYKPANKSCIAGVQELKK